MTECQVRLDRDAFNTPWGFRLQGGKDFNTPLTVQRVFVGSPADGELHRGDIILAIDNYDVTQMSHKHAQDLIKKAGGSLSIRIRRSAKVGPPSAGVPAPAQNKSAGYRSRPLDNHNPAPTPALGTFNPPSRPTQMSGGFQGYGVDYNRPRGATQFRPAPAHYGGSVPMSPVGGGDAGMLNRVNQTLSEVVWQPQSYNQDHQPSYNQNQQVPRTGSGSRGASRPWTKPPIDMVPAGLSEPGWTPKTMTTPHASHGRTAPAPTHYQPPPPAPSYQQQQQVPRQAMGRPAWSGTLRSSGAPKPWEVVEGQTIAGGLPPEQQPTCERQMSGGGHVPAHTGPVEPVVPHQPKVQNVHYAPGEAPTYEQHAPDQHASDTAQVTHAQYNTPIGLYSQDNVQAALDSQTVGKPGQGTLQVTGPGGKKFDPAQSDVYRLLMEEEDHKRPPRGHGLPQQNQAPVQSARYQNQAPGNEMHYQGYQDHTIQSRSMHALEHNMAQDEEFGTSDF